MIGLTCSAVATTRFGRWIDALIVAIVALLALPAMALASGEFEFTIHGYYIIDFLVFVGVLVWVGRKPLAKMLDQRYKDVAREIEEARALKLAAQARYDEYAARTSALEHELRKILDEVREGTRAEVERILAEAEALVARMAAEEQVRISQESKRLRALLASETAELAVSLADANLRARLDEDGQNRLIDQSLVDLQRVSAEVQA